MTIDSRDSLQAHRFRGARLRTALLQGDAESSSRSWDRYGTGTLAGIVVTIALLAAAGVVGVLWPGGSTAWQQTGAFVIDRDTGTRYVVVDGVLHPVPNLTTAKLLLGSDFHVVTVSGRALGSTPRGAQLGIPLAPDALPDAAQIVGTDWSVCATGDPADGDRWRTAMFPGRAASGEPVGTQDGYLVSTPDGRLRLIWSGAAHEIPEPWSAALGYREAAALPVGDDLIEALPVGKPLAPPELTGIGQPGPALPGSIEPVVVGSIFADRVNSFYVMTQAGLAALTPLQADLLLADQRLRAAYGGGNPSPLPISQVQVTEAMPAPLAGPGTGRDAPAQAPSLVGVPAGQRQLCANYAGQDVPAIVTGPADPAAVVSTGLVQLPSGAGALVATRPDPDVPGTTVYLVTDTGVRYPVSGQQTLERLGLAGLTVAQLPAAVVGVVPEGPILDPAAAARPVG